MSELPLKRQVARLVPDALAQLIAHQVALRGLVVWFDPERQYEQLLPDLDFGDAELRRYGGSFFELRHEIESFLAGEQAPRLVVYVPLAAADTHDALIEATAAGVTIYPGANPWQRNTRLSVIATHALRGRVSEARAAYLAREMEAGRISIDEVERLAEQDGGGKYPSLMVIFATTDPMRIARDFLSSAAQDVALVERGALTDLTNLLADQFGTQPNARTTVDLRARLATQVLLADLRGSTGADLPSLPAGPEPDGSAAAACRVLARDWRNSRDLVESYVAWSGEEERDLQIAALSFSLDELRRTETFACLEAALQAAVEAALTAEVDEALVMLSEQRRSGFWSQSSAEIQTRWSLIATAGEVLREAQRVAEALKAPSLSAEDLAEAYTVGEHPWCLLDSAQRRMERLFHLFDLDPHGRHKQLHQLVTRARQRYMEVASTLAERFVHAYQDAGFRIRGLTQQRQVFGHEVAPALRRGKTAYVLVDALRFEMARELIQRFQSQYDVTLSAATATAPTITEIGMAALMPGADGDARVIQAGESKLALDIDGAPLRDRSGRIAFLKSRAGVSVCALKLGDLLPLRRQARAEIERASLIVVTSQEIDDLGEGDNVEAARRQMDDVLGELARAVHVLAGLGVQSLVLTADHGFIFGDELDAGMKIEPPRGETVDLHRRVWVGRGGAQSPAYLRVPLERLVPAGDLDLATPWGFGAFKVAGGMRAYFHGGLSPQELLIPIVVLVPKQAQNGPAPNAFEWALQPGRERITTRFFSVQVGGRLRQLLGADPPAVRVELRSGQEVVSQAVSASYGFDDATHSLQLRAGSADDRTLEPNTVALMLTREPPPASVTIHLVDTASGRELAHSGPVAVAIAI